MKDIMTREGTVPPGSSGRVSVSISSNPRKEKEMLDKDGNVINPRTKQIIRPASQN